MTRDDIIRMAEQADGLESIGGYTFTSDGLQRFATLVAAAEQDRCCKIVYSMAGSDNVAQRTVDAIRGKE